MSRWDKFTGKELHVLREAMKFTNEDFLWAKENEEVAGNLELELKHLISGDLQKRDQQFVDAVLDRHSEELQLEKMTESHVEMFNEITEEYDTLLEGLMIARLLEESFEKALIKNARKMGDEAEEEAKKFVKKFNTSQISRQNIVEVNNK